MVKDLIIFVGPPGSGKGTQADILVKEQGYLSLSPGALFRAEIARGSDIGKQVKSVLDAGKLVDTKLTLATLAAEMERASQTKFIFDGFPRSMEQVNALAEFLKANKEVVLRCVIHFHVNEAEVIRRLTNRLTCPKCGAIFNVLTANPPKKEGVCDFCQTALKRRDDDQDATTIANRNKVYTDSIKDMLDFYKKSNLMHEIDALKNVPDVSADIARILNNKV